MSKIVLNIFLIYAVSFNILGSELNAKSRIQFIKESIQNVSVFTALSFINNEIAMIKNLDHPYNSFSPKELEKIKNDINKIKDVFNYNTKDEQGFFSKVWNWLVYYSPYIFMGVIFIGVLLRGDSLFAKEDKNIDSTDYYRGDSGKSGHYKTSFTKNPKILWKTVVNKNSVNKLSSQPIVVKIGNQKKIFFTNGLNYHLVDKNNGKNTVKKHITTGYDTSKPTPLNVKDRIIFGDFEVGKFNNDNLNLNKKIDKDCWNFHYYEEKAYCITSKYIYQYDLRNKKLKHFSINFFNYNFIYPYSVRKGNILYISGGKFEIGAVVAFDLKTKKVKWKKIIQEYVNSLTLKGDSLYFFSYAGVLYSLSAETGKTNWKNTTYTYLSTRIDGNHYPLPGSDGIATDGKSLFMCLSDNQLVQLSAKKGHYIKSTNINIKDEKCYSVIIAGDQVVIGISDGSVRGMLVNDITKTLWTLKNAGGNWNSPLLIDRKLYYFNTINSTLYALGSKD